MEEGRVIDYNFPPNLLTPHLNNLSSSEREVLRLKKTTTTTSDPVFHVVYNNFTVVFNISAALPAAFYLCCQIAVIVVRGEKEEGQLLGDKIGESNTVVVFSEDVNFTDIQVFCLKD